MKLVPPEKINRDDVYYIPHHALFHNEKIQVVFDASKPSYNGQSLNHTLHSGSKLQQDIVLVLIKWQCFKYVFTCDIIKIFRKILIHPLNRDWLKIVYDFGNGFQHF